MREVRMNTMLRSANPNVPSKVWTFENTQRLELVESLLNRRIGIRSAKFHTVTGAAYAQLIADIESIELVRDSLSGMNIDEIEVVLVAQQNAFSEDRANDK
jgi:hypothetical protein